MVVPLTCGKFLKAYDGELPILPVVLSSIPWSSIVSDNNSGAQEGYDVLIAPHIKHLEAIINALEMTFHYLIGVVEAILGEGSPFDERSLYSSIDAYTDRGCSKKS